MRIIQPRIIYSFLRKTSMIVPSGMASIYRRMLTFDGCSFGKEPKGVCSFSLAQRKRTKRDIHPHQGLSLYGEDATAHPVALTLR